MRALLSRDELIDWAEDEGALDDSIILAVSTSPAAVTVGLRIQEEASGDPREAFRRTSERYLPFRLSSDEGVIAVSGELAPNAAFEAALLEKKDAFGLRLDTSEAAVEASARSWRVDVGDPVAIAVVHAVAPARLTFHGDGPLTSTQLLGALFASETRVLLFGNWNGSGQSMGAAFVRNVEVPLLVADDTPLEGAWRIVPAGADATDPRGVWLTGNARGPSAYATVERTAESDPALVRMIVEALASLPGLAWASSGNQLVDDPAARAAWLASI